MESSKQQTLSIELHPCQYCTKPCKGKQCRDCHLKMVAKEQTKCMDCNKVFRGLRADGTFRKRCNDCHSSYKERHMATCVCGDEYHAFLDDGRTFDKCFKCYQESCSKCEKCSKRTFNSLPMCSECYKENRDKKEKENMVEEKNHCKTKNCKNTTAFTYCKECFRKNKETTKNYMIYTCRDCGVKGRGDYKLCADCDTN